jgi:single-strand DNA-binding protein
MVLTEGSFMKDMNKIFIMGRLGADPEIRETKTGGKMAVFSVATSRWVKDGAEPVTQWHKVVAWGKQSETCAMYLKKGRSVLVEGSIRMQKYKDKDGIERRSTEIFADDVTFLNGQQKAQGSEEVEEVQEIENSESLAS